MSPTNYLGKEKIAPMGRPRSIEGNKVDKASAGYRTKDIRCSNCIHFDGVDTCTEVDGVIDPDESSDFFEAKEEQPEETGGEMEETESE